MGDFAGISLFDSKNEECSKCGMEKHGESTRDCCKDVSITIKTGDFHTFSQVAYDFNSFSLAIPEYNFTICDVRIDSHNNNTTYRAHSPPLLEYPLFIQHQNFRI